MLGVSIAIGAALYDMLDAHRAVRRYSREEALMLFPALIPTHAEPAIGFSLGMALE